MTDKSTSDRRRRANQANAKLSTGPRSKAGKARSSGNALRDGLSIPIWRDLSLTTEAEALAERIAGPDASNVKADLARSIAAAQVDVMRIRAIRHKKIKDLILDRAYQPSVFYMRSFDPARARELFDECITNTPKTVPKIRHVDGHFYVEENVPGDNNKRDSNNIENMDEATIMIEAARRYEENRHFLAPPLKGRKKLAFVLETKALELMRLDRYERRALSRRKSAIRKFNAYVTTEET